MAFIFKSGYGKGEKMKPGSFISEITNSIEPVEVTKVISKEFIYGIYKFLLLPNNGMLNVDEYFKNREGFLKGYKFKEELMEVFVERHRYYG